jgi:hypothetical protein
VGWPVAQTAADPGQARTSRSRFSSHPTPSVRTCVLPKSFSGLKSKPSRSAAQASPVAASAAEIGPLSDRELLIAGAVAYWCEGLKGKPRQRCDRVVFVNSDPRLIGFFLCFLDSAGFDREKLGYRLLIHENADIRAAERFWPDMTGAEPGQFKKPSLKRHNPKTVRKKVGADYHGCLVISVQGSTEPYQRIEGWAKGAMRACSE